MPQQSILFEGALTNDTRNALNNNFSELYTEVMQAQSITAATYSVVAADSGKLFILNKADGIAITLPAATGSGLYWQFVVGTTLTSNTITISVANANDTMAGVATMGSSGGTSLSTGTASTGAVSGQTDRITFNGTTQAGIKGTYVEVRDIGANQFWVTVHGVASGVAVTPFSAAV